MKTVGMAADHAGYALKEELKSLLEEEGLTVSYLTDEEMQVFIDAVQPLYEEFAASGIEPNFEEYYAFAQELNEKIRKEAETNPVLVIKDRSPSYSEFASRYSSATDRRESYSDSSYG